VFVIEASQNPGKIGYRVVENIIEGGYKGSIE
jgi:acyl-CoA synthetase (NDP forming)